MTCASTSHRASTPSKRPYLPDLLAGAKEALHLVGERFGVGHVVNVLRGGETEKILQCRHTELSTYGLMKDVAPDPGELFEHVYAEPTQQLREQAAFLQDELAREEA